MNETNLRIECIKIASTLHPNSADMTISAAEKIYNWINKNQISPQPETKQINS